MMLDMEVAGAVTITSMLSSISHLEWIESSLAWSLVGADRVGRFDVTHGSSSTTASRIARISDLYCGIRAVVGDSVGYLWANKDRQSFSTERNIF